MDFIATLLSTPWVQTIISTLTGTGMLGILAVAIKLIGVYKSHAKANDSAIEVSEASLALLKVKEADETALRGKIDAMQADYDKMQQLLQLMLLNAKNPEVRARAAELITSGAGAGAAAKELISTVPSIDEKQAAEQKIDEVSALIASLAAAGEAGA